MRRTKTMISSLLAVCTLLAGCSATAGRPAASAAETSAEIQAVETDAVQTEETKDAETVETAADSETRIVVDHAGNEIEIPAQINRIVISSILPLPSVYCLFEGSAEKLVGIHPSSMAAAENSILPQVVPDIVDVNTDFLTGGDLNVEELMKLKPDVVFYSANNVDEYEKLAAAGISAIGFSTSQWNYDCVATFENWVMLLGDVLQQEDKAKGIADHGYEVYDEIQEVFSAAGEIDKPKVLILFNYNAGVIKTSGSDFFGQYWIESTGGINVAEGLSGSPEINMEQIYAWNPDIIYITNFSPYLPEDLYGNDIDGHDWSTVKAVKEGQVYKFPLGMYRWFPPASDTPLVLKWLACHNQPELFAGIDMEQEVKDYYLRYYDMDVTDEMLEQIFHPAREAAGV